MKIAEFCILCDLPAVQAGEQGSVEVIDLSVGRITRTAGSPLSGGWIPQSSPWAHLACVKDLGLLFRKWRDGRK